MGCTPRHRLIPAAGLSTTFLFFLGFAVTLNAEAQKSAEADTPKVIFGTVAADKGTIASLPVYINAGKVALRRLKISVDFISNSVKFERLDTSAALNSSDTHVSVDVQELPLDPKGLPRTRLKLLAETPKALSAGLLVFLNFKLLPDAKPFAVSLQVSEASGEDIDGKPLAPTSEAGKVIVSAEDEEVIGCFFFTH